MANEETQKAAAAKALAEGLNLETVEPTAGGKDVDDFFESVAKATQPQVEETDGGAKKWVHEPTGKEFESELEYLRFNSGYDMNRMGTENKKLSERLAKLEGQLEANSKENGNHKPPDRDALKQMLWPSRSKDILEESGADFVYEGMENLAQLVLSEVDKKLGGLESKFSQTTTEFQTEAARARLGVTPEIEQEILSQHPALAGLAPGDRLAVVKSLSAAMQAANSGSTGRLADKLRGLNPSDHVEGSMLSNPTGTSDEVLEREFEKLDSKSQLGVIGRLVAQSGGFGGYTRD